MPTSAVYQPTTVTYEQQPNDQRWNCPISYFSRRVTSSLNRTLCVRLAFGLVCGTLFIIGLALAIAGGVQLSNLPPEERPTGNAKNPNNGPGALLLCGVLLSMGALFTGLAGLAYFYREATMKQAQASGTAALTALNPSTDPLVAAQYAPVRDAPPAPDDEMRNLMDNKECLSSAEESDKMLDGRPSLA